MKRTENDKMELSVNFYYQKLHIMLLIFAILFTGSILVTILPAPVNAADITLTWNRNTEPDIAGYKIFYGTQSQTYSNTITIFDSSTEPAQCTYTIHGLEEAQTYYVALKSFDLGGNESPYSSETVVNILSDNSDPYDVYGNSLTNGTMENGSSETLGWYLYDVESKGKPTNQNPGEWTAEESHTGTYSFKLHNETGSYLGCYGEEVRFDAPYPKTLLFGGWSKAHNVQRGGFYCLDFKVTLEDGTVRWYYYPLKFDTGTHDWQLKQIVKTWNKGVVAVQPYLLLYKTTGTVWFDDIFVIPEPDNLIYNSTLEKGKSFVSGWHLYEQVTQGKQANVDPGEWGTDESHEGTHSVKIQNTTATYVGWYGEKVRFDAPYPKTLLFGGWSKAHNVQRGGFYCLDFKVTFEDGTVRWYYYPLKFDAGTHDWQLKQIVKTWNKGVVAVQPYLLLYKTTGIVWFDDIFVKTQ